VPVEFLYIPHGSDERTLEATEEISLTNFISHMVQMKVIVKLYSQVRVVDFISHMVQMKVM